MQYVIGVTFVVLCTLAIAGAAIYYIDKAADRRNH